jgi:hypothetical protein
MKEHQARGYIFESIIWDMLLKNGYTNPAPEKEIRGRGAFHQIDAYGHLTYPVPYVYPIRLLSEAKCYKRDKKVDLTVVRNFVGVIKDISEYYIVNDDGTHNTFRYTDVGCIFSSTPFTADAQNYAWAHNIRLVPFTTEEFQIFVQAINDFVEFKKNELGSFQIQQIKDDFKTSTYYSSIKDKFPTLTMGIFDEVYPIVLISQKKWLTNDQIPQDSDTIQGRKISRQNLRQINLGVRFDLNILGVDVFFTLPDYIAMKVISKIKERDKDNDVFELNIPVLFKPFEKIQNPKDAIRRTLRVKIDMEDPHLLTEQKEILEQKIGKKDNNK